MERVTVLFCFLVVLSTAQKTGFGPCPDALPLSSLDVKRYLGKWHEIYKIPNFFEADQSCITANYSLKADGHIKVFNQGVTNGQPVSKTGDAYVPNPSEPAKLMVKFSENSPYAPYWVLDTDYTNYTVVFSCESFGKIAHAQFAWILSRNITITESLNQKLFQTLENNGVPASYLKKADQSNCTSSKK